MEHSRCRQNQISAQALKELRSACRSGTRLCSSLRSAGREGGRGRAFSLIVLQLSVRQGCRTLPDRFIAGQDKDVFAKRKQLTNYRNNSK